MVTKEEKEKKNKRAGMIISAGSHIVLILLFIFLIAWRAPNPPLPEIGIELNFGTSDVGTGDIQPETTAAEAEAEEAAPDTPEAVEEEVVEETIETAEEAEEAQEEVEEATEMQEEITPVTDTPTEDAIKEVKEKTTEKSQVAELVEATPPKVLYPGTKEGAAGTTGDRNNPAAANQGDKTDAVGDQGDEEGNIDARSLYGKPGGGGGSSLEMTGWKWDSEPNPQDNTSQSGKIVFILIIDQRGEVTSVKVDSYTVSASLVRLYQAEVERLTFSKTSSAPAPPSSKGRITFIIKAK